jgi:hypothetical protein
MSINCPKKWNWGFNSYSLVPRKWWCMWCKETSRTQTSCLLWVSLLIINNDVANLSRLVPLSFRDDAQIAAPDYLSAVRHHAHTNQRLRKWEPSELHCGHAGCAIWRPNFVLYLLGPTSEMQRMRESSVGVGIRRSWMRQNLLKLQTSIYA